MAKKDKAAEPSVVAVPVTIKLKNQTRSHLVFNLPHAQYCSDGECACAMISRRIEEYDFRNREHVAKMVDQRICASISWLAGETLDCDPRVQKVSAIAAAIERQDLANA